MNVGRIVVIAAVTAALLRAQPRPGPDFSAHSRIVVVPVTVTDPRGAFVPGLPADAFTISENGARQQIRSFAEDDAPVSIGIVLDLSGSMKNVLGISRESLRRFAALSNPHDEAFLSVVSDRPRLWSGFTSDFDGLVNYVAFERAAGSTALIDTVWGGLTELRDGRRTRKALLVISDGMDNHSRRSRAELLSRAMESDAQIYTITMAEPAPNLKAAGLIERQNGMSLMSELADRTGGLSFLVRDESAIERAITDISRALREQYNIGYVPAARGDDGKWRRIQVRVAHGGMKAHARAGYRSTN